MLRDASVWVDYFQSKRIPVAFARWHSFIVFKLKNNGKFHRESATAIHVCEKMNPPDDQSGDGFVEKWIYRLPLVNFWG